MTQDQLTKILENRDWTVADVREQADWKKESCGISIRADSPTGYTLSIQGGEGLYSEPRRKSESYTEVEFAIWKTGSNKEREGKFIRDSRIKDTCDDVYSYETFEVLMRAIDMIESWKDGNGPVVSISRDNAPYRDLN